MKQWMIYKKMNMRERQIREECEREISEYIRQREEYE